MSQLPSNSAVLRGDGRAPQPPRPAPGPPPFNNPAAAPPYPPNPFTFAQQLPIDPSSIHTVMGGLFAVPGVVPSMSTLPLMQAGQMIPQQMPFGLPAPFASNPPPGPPALGDPAPTGERTRLACSSFVFVTNTMSLMHVPHARSKYRIYSIPPIPYPPSRLHRCAAALPSGSIRR